MKIGRNDTCHCGSGKKYKKCCAARDDVARSAELAEAAARAAMVTREGPPEQGSALKASSSSPATGTAPRPKGPPPKSPTQLRRRSV
jgi:hypothetical protein